MVMDQTLINSLIPKNVKTAVLTQIERITQPVTDFIRGNPIVSTAAVGIGTTGLIAGIATVVRKKSKKKRATVKRKTKKKTKRGRSRDRKFISKQKHEQAYVKRKKKRGKKITRKRYRTKKPRRLVKGSKEAKAYMAKLRRMRK